jgi:hypothetical protein
VRLTGTLEFGGDTIEDAALAACGSIGRGAKFWRQGTEDFITDVPQLSSVQVEAPPANQAARVGLGRVIEAPHDRAGPVDDRDLASVEHSDRTDVDRALLLVLEVEPTDDEAIRVHRLELSDALECLFADAALGEVVRATVRPVADVSLLSDLPLVTVVRMIYVLLLCSELGMPRGHGVLLLDWGDTRES